MTFTQAEQWILSLHNMPRKEYMKSARECAISLKRLQFFLDLVGNPEKKIPHYIHVTGTSGKGSVTSFLHSILQESGVCVGSTYSPHPSVITERWKVGRAYMSNKEFAEIVSSIRPVLDRYIRATPYDMVSFFEITEVIGLLFFAKRKVRWAVMEVACGGRYDASNIIPRKEVAVITNIGLDHLGVIGNNKEEIAHEKSGIIKPGCAVFTQEKNKKILDIIQKECLKQKIKTIHATQTKDVTDITCSVDATTFSYQGHRFKLSASGQHQIRNSVLCIDIARHLNIPWRAIQKGLSCTHQPLRMEVISRDPLVILDGAHNPDKIRSTVAAMRIIGGVGDICLVVGFSGDKQIPTMIKHLASLKPTYIAITRNTVNPFRKVADPKMVQTLFKKYSPSSRIEIFLDPMDALVSAKKQAKKDGVVLVTGSIFVSGELRGKIKIHPR